MKAGHGAKILTIFLALKQVFDALFDAVGDLAQSVFAAFLFHGIAPFKLEVKQKTNEVLMRLYLIDLRKPVRFLSFNP